MFAPPVPHSIPVERGGCPFDVPAALGELRDDCPVSAMVFPGDGHEGRLIMGHAAVRAVLSDTRFSSRGELARVPIGIGHRPGRHTVPRGMFSRLDAMARQGAPADLVRDFALPTRRW